MSAASNKWYVTYRYYHDGWTPHHHGKFPTLWKAFRFVWEKLDEHGAKGTVEITIGRWIFG